MHSWSLGLQLQLLMKYLRKSSKMKLRDCVVKMIEDWSFNRPILDVNHMKIDDEIKISEMVQIKSLRFSTGEFSWSSNYDTIIVIKTEN